MELPAKGTEPVHRWVVVSLTNSHALPREVVVATPHQGFAGSGILWPKPIGSRIQNVVAAGQADDCAFAGNQFGSHLRFASSPKAG